MKYIKNINEKLFNSKKKLEDEIYNEYDSRVGNYFIVTNTHTDQYSDEFDSFLDSHIGVIHKIDKNINFSKHKIPKKYESEKPFIHGNFLFDLNDTQQTVEYFDIIHTFRIDVILSSPNKEYLESILQSKKYNL